VSVATTTTVDTLRPADTIRPGEVIATTNVSTTRTYLSPGGYVLVTRGVPVRVVSSSRLDWPPPYRVATERYSSPVSLSADGALNGYVAGLPFPPLDANDPAIATKNIWNYTYRPMYSDDFDIRHREMATYTPWNDATPVNYFIVGHMAPYNNVARVEVPPTPTDPDPAPLVRTPGISTWVPWTTRSLRPATSKSRAIARSSRTCENGPWEQGPKAVPTSNEASAPSYVAASLHHRG
jgi:hypothetical protein